MEYAKYELSKEQYILLISSMKSLYFKSGTIRVVCFISLYDHVHDPNIMEKMF